MSTNGDIEIAVKAEGVDDAAGDMAGEGDGVPSGGGGGGGGDGPDGLRGALRAGLLAGVLTAVLGPLLDVLGALLEVLQAFLAPVAAVIMRLLAPVLRLLITKVLPAWLDLLDLSKDQLDFLRKFLSVLGFIGMLLTLNPAAISALLFPALKFIQTKIDDLKQAAVDWLQKGFDWVVGGLGDLAGNIWDFVSQGFARLRESLAALPERIWEKVKQLSGMISRELAARLPNVDAPSPSDVADRGSDALDQLRGRFGGASQTTNIEFSGGLDAFVERVEQDSSIDLP